MGDLLGHLVERWSGRPLDQISDADLETFAEALTTELDADDPICAVLWRHLEQLRESREWRPYDRPRHRAGD